MNPLTEARLAVADALKPIVGTNVYAAPPASITTPGAVVLAGDPWAAPLTFTRTEVRFVVTLAAGQLGTNVDAFERLEQLVWDAVALIRAAGMAVGSVSTIRSQKYGQADVAALDLEIRVLVDDEQEGES